MPEPQDAVSIPPVESASRINSRLVRWSQLLALTGASQVTVQALGFFSGLLVIRLLPVQEYAFYTIANSLLATMVNLADAGISIGVIAQGGKVWQSRERLGAVVVSGLTLRRRFAIGSISVAFPALIILILYNHGTWKQALILACSIVPAFWSAISDSLLEVPAKLTQDIKALQKNQIAAAGARLAGTACLVLSLPIAAMGMLAAGISRMWANYRLRSIAARHADMSAQASPEIEKDILRIVRKVFPTTLYYCVSGQLTIWILSILGTTTAVSQIGALSGLSTALGLFAAIFTVLAVPRFARIPSNRKLLIERFLLLQCGLIGVSLLIIACTYIFAHPILLVLGRRFTGLRIELTLMAVQTCIGLISSSTHQLSSSRGIIVPPSLYIACALLAQVGFVFVLPVQTISGALWYGIANNATTYFVRIIYLGFVGRSRKQALA